MSAPDENQLPENRPGFNERLAALITSAVGTMWCAYLFMALSLVSLPNALRTHDPIVIVNWISQTCFQLVLLSVIMVGQRVLARRQEVHAERLAALHDKHDAIHGTKETP